MSTELTPQDEDNIILPSALQDFTTPQQLRKAFVAFKKLCEANNQVRTLPGLCRALNISKEKYLAYRNGEYKKEFEQMELSIKHECINKGIKFAGAWKYLENEFPEDYKKEVESPTNPQNIIFNVEQLNLIARRIIAGDNTSAKSPDRLRDSDKSEIPS